MVTLINRNAVGIVRQLLESYDLSYPENRIREWVEAIADDPQNIVRVEEDIRQSDRFKARFAALKARQDAGLPAISVDEYLQLERDYRSIFRIAGLPERMWDSWKDFTNMIAHDLAPSEVESRVADGFVAAQYASDEVKQALNQFYGIRDTEGALAAYYLDPERALPAIEREFEAAMIGARAVRTGFEGVTRQFAEQIASYDLTQEAVQRGFETLVEDRELLAPNLSVGRRFTVAEQIRQAFGGSQTLTNAIEQQRRQRLAQFSGATRSSRSQFGIEGMQRVAGS